MEKTHTEKQLSQFINIFLIRTYDLYFDIFG